MLATLAIVSLVSAALFQTSAHWARLSSRSAEASERSLAAVTDQAMFERVVTGLIFSWPERDDAFRGGPQGFSGLTRRAIHKIEPGLYEISLGVSADGVALVYDAEEVAWRIKTIGYQSAAFSYLGADLRWREFWPPEATPEPGPFQDAAHFAVPALPKAIRLDFTQAGAARTWIAPIRNDEQPPLRERDIVSIVDAAGERR